VLAWTEALSKDNVVGECKCEAFDVTHLQGVYMLPNHIGVIGPTLKCCIFKKHTGQRNKGRSNCYKWQTSENPSYLFFWCSGVTVDLKLLALWAHLL